jgi:sugar phosphate isomerase/epimerase
MTAMLRRAFLQCLGGGSLAAAPAGPRIPLGLDAYSVRAFQWKAMRLLEYAASLKLDSIQLSAPGDYESIEPAHLARVRERAAALGLAIDAAIGKICPTTGRWTLKESPEEYARMGLRVAKAVGARQMRCFVGGFESRGGDPPFAAHMESTLKVLRAVRSEALDLGVKIGIENHGDFEARELRRLIEEAGPDFTGCCLDTGNPLRVLEDPLMTLEVLAPYVVSSHVRDSVVYEHPRGAAFQWVALGDGCIDFRGFSAAFGRLCPDIPMQLEVITGRPPTVLPYLEPDFWKAFPDKPAAGFARFLALARNGRPFAGAMMIGGGGKQPPAYEAALKEQQRVDVDRSVAHGRSVLGLGRKS